MGAADRRGPFASLDPHLNVVSIQLFLFVISVPAFLLAALSGEKTRAEQSVRAAHEALRESEARFRTVADAAPVLIWMAGVDKLCTFFSKPWLDFTGRTLEEELGNGWAEGVHPADLPGCLKAYADAFDARQAFLLHYRLRRHDGEYRWISDNGVPRYDAQHAFCGYVGACYDVTPIKRAEHKFRLAVESSPNAIVLADQQGRIVLANRQAEQLFGYADGELVGRSVESLVPERFRQAHARDRNEFLAAMQARELGRGWELFAQRKGGEEFQVEVGLNPIHAEKEVLLFITISNVTEKRRQERALRESEERMNMAAEAANLGMWVWDRSQPTIWATEKFHQMFGFASESQITPGMVNERIHPQDRAAVNFALQRTLKKGGDDHLEYRLRLADGTVRWIASQGRAEFDSEGKFMRLLGVCIDITERRRTQEEAQELSGRLITAQEDERSRLARDLHDEFSQSLALLAVDLDLLGQHPPEKAAAVRSKVEELSVQVRALSLEAHRLSHELHPSKLEQLGLTAAMRSFCKDLQASHQIAIGFEARAVPRNLSAAVALCLYRIAQEALQNVVKHSSATSVRVELTSEGNEIHLTVIDDGTGFDIRAAQTKGSLGLVSMRERARLVHGQITWEAKKGLGTRIEVRVPLEPPA
jgi:PAS domain S-box-containing protein